MSGVVSYLWEAVPLGKRCSRVPWDRLLAIVEDALAADLKPSYSYSTHRWNRAKSLCGLKSL